MSSVLAKFQAAYKNNPTSLQGAMNTAPTAVTTPTAKAPTPVQSAPTMGAMAGITAGLATPVQSTPNMGTVTAGIKPPAPVQTPVQTAVQQPNTNYVANGGSALNEILYNKGIYNASNKDYIAKTVAPLYGQLDQQTATAVKGMDYNQLKNYINGLGSKSAPTPTAAPMEAPPQYAEQATDYNSLAQAAYQREQAAMDAAAGVNDKEIVRRNDYSVGVTKDNRTLRDASYYRNNVPSSRDGSTDYRTAMKERGDGIEDHYTTEGLTDARAGAWSQANAFRDQSGNYMETKSNELSTAAQQLAIQEGGLTGMYKGKQTLAGSGQAWNQQMDVTDRMGTLNGQQTMQGASNAANLAGQQIQNQIAAIDLKTYPQEKQLAIQKVQQDLAGGKINNAAAQYQLDELTNPNSVTNQVKGIQLEISKIDLSTYSQEKQLAIQQIQKNIEQIGKVPYQSSSDQRMDELKIEMAELELEKLTNPTAATKKFEDYSTDIERIAQREDGELTNPTAVEDYIVNSDMSEYEMYRAYGAYGLKWEGAVPPKGE